jgi:hypothetical protein
MQRNRPCRRQLQKEPPGDRPSGSFYSQPSSAPIATTHKTVIAEAISGNNSTSIKDSRYVKCFATIRYSNTDPNAARVTVILNTVPIIADRIGVRDSAGFTFFIFCFFVATSRPYGFRSIELTLLPVGFIFRSLGRQCHGAQAKSLKHTVNRR